MIASEVDKIKIYNTFRLVSCKGVVLSGSNSGSDYFLQDAKINFFIFFLITYPQAHYVQSLKPNADETVQKIQKRTLNYKCFLESNFANINGLGGSILSKKVKIVVPYSTPL
jgi:hypothetical protein